MKRAILFIALMLLATPTLAATSHEMKTESGWFDMENCVFCKNLVKDPELLDHVTWENHAIANGMINITAVDPAYAESLAKANAAMEAVGKKIETGQVNPMELEMCGMCSAFGQLMMAGVEMQTVKGKAADVTLMTSDDAAVVAKLHELVKRNNKEMALMAGGGHEGHAH